MKKLLLFILLPFLVTSCIQDEPFNSEADILMFEIPEELTYASASITNNQVTLFVKNDGSVNEEQLKNINPIVKLSEGATISPSTKNCDLTKSLEFTVTSQDGKYSKKYKIVIFSIELAWDFEDWYDKVSSFGFYPKLNDLSWNSGNMGIWSADMKNKTNYPTKDTTDCFSGQKAALLETLKGKVTFGVDIPIYSGSLFYGVFKLIKPDYANGKYPSQGVMFGQPYAQTNGKPVSFTGYYKYFPGEVYTDENKNILPDVIDECTIRAFLYRVKKGAITGTKGEEYITGYDNVFESSQLVAIADLKDCSAKQSFTKFDIKFEYRQNIDYNQYDYRLAIVFASSKDGEKYRGAVGSRLIIDDVKVICEK